MLELIGGHFSLKLVFDPIAPSTLSHHLDKLRNEGLVKVRRDKKFLWHTADTASLQELLGFLFSERCSGNQAVKATAIFELCS